MPNPSPHIYRHTLCVFSYLFNPGHIYHHRPVRLQYTGRAGFHLVVKESPGIKVLRVCRSAEDPLRLYVDSLRFAGLRLLLRRISETL